MAKIDLKYCTVTVKDGAAKTLDIKVGEGNLTYSEKRTIEYVLDRGLLDTCREGDQVPVEVSMQLVWEFLRSSSGDTDVTPEEAIKGIGRAAAGGEDPWTTSSDDACEPYAVDIEITYNPSCGTVEDEVVTLSDFRWETMDHDYKAGTLSCTGKCNIAVATVARE